MAALRLNADVIVLNDGNIIVADKAWVEGEVVQYQTSRGVQTLPKSSVREIQEQRPAPRATGTQAWGFGEVVGGPVQGCVVRRVVR